MGYRQTGPLLRAFLSPTGAGLVLICFFLPWVRVSCGGKEMIISGHTLGGVFWVVLAAAGLSMLAFFYFNRRRKIKNARPFLMASALLALGIILYKYISVVRDPDIPFYVPASAIHVDIKPGAVGTIVGLLMVGVGSLVLKPKEKKMDNPGRATHPAERSQVDD